MGAKVSQNKKPQDACMGAVLTGTSQTTPMDANQEGSQ